MDFDEFFLTLPEDPDEAFIVFQKQKWAELEEALNNNGSGWHNERSYINAIIAFEEVYQLGGLSEIQPPRHMTTIFPLTIRFSERT